MEKNSLDNFEKIPVQQPLAIAKPNLILSRLQWFTGCLMFGLFLAKRIRTNQYYLDFEKIHGPIDGPFQFPKIIHFLIYVLEKWVKIRIYTLKKIWDVINKAFNEFAKQWNSFSENFHSQTFEENYKSFKNILKGIRCLFNILKESLVEIFFIRNIIQIAMFIAGFLKNIVFLNQKRIYIYGLGFLGVVIGFFLDQYDLFTYKNTKIDLDLDNRWIRILYLLFACLLVDEWCVLNFWNALSLIYSILLGLSESERIEWQITDKNKWVFRIFNILILLLILEEWLNCRFWYPYPLDIEEDPLIPITPAKRFLVKEPRIIMLPPREPEPIIFKKPWSCPYSYLAPEDFPFPVVVEDPTLIIETTVIFEEPVKVELFKSLPNLKKVS